MALTKITSDGIGDNAITADKIASGAVTVSDIPDGEITTAKIADAAITHSKLHTTAIQDKLGYTPVNPSSLGTLASLNSVSASNITDSTITANKLASGVAVSNIGYTPINKAGDTFTGSLNLPNGVVIGDASITGTTWRVMDSIAIGDSTIHRRSRRFDANGASSATRDIFQFRTNRGWSSYFLKVHIYEYGYLGTAYRSATVSQHGTGTNIVGGDYSPYWRYDLNPGGMHGSLNFTGTGPTGGGTDVGWYDITAQVIVASYTSAYIVVEYGAVSSVTVNGTFNSKGQLNFL
jgi:hypothetical protein